MKQGDLLLEFDLDSIKQERYDVNTPVIVCNTANYPDMVCRTGTAVKELDPVLEL